MEIHRSRPSLNMQLFFNAKSEELIKIYLPAQPAKIKFTIYYLNWILLESKIQ